MTRRTTPALKAAPVRQAAELRLIDDVRFFDDNLKQRLGKDFASALDASIEDAGFSGSMVLTPPCDEEHAPELAAAYGSNGRHIAADGNARLERIKELGYRWILIIPQPEEDDAANTAAVVRAILAAGDALLETLTTKVRGGEKIAFGRVNPRLVTPDRVLRFVLGYDRGRAKYDENLVQSAIEELIKRRPESRDLVWRLSVQKQSLVKKVLDADKQAERERREAEEREAKAKAELALAEAQRAARAAASGEPGAGADGAPPSAPDTKSAPPEVPLSPEALKLQQKKQLRENAVRYPFLFQFTKPGAQVVDECLRRMQTSLVQPGREGRLITAMEQAVALLDEEGLKSALAEVAITTLHRHLQMVDAERADKAKAKA